ncbi:alpha/beta fold hydrolase [Nocardia flavorosea]|uniref:Alpha/beta hydrolase n=1 Tax=Nocardia flavorosea TaxID=53429 RepID=A0A846YLV4_9NOCA|nr:alpha/beta hydrolase [Nocardia flavorosea]NKY58472.1 alpha/beta hydrolase [Nocardia flavorosea]
MNAQTRRAYAEFLPEPYRSDPIAEPVSEWWEWRGRRVHMLRAAVPDAPVRLLAIHGAGGHSGLLWPAVTLGLRENVDATAVDLPLYGRTVEPDPAGVRYGEWVDLLCDLVHTQAAADERPIVLFGASMGGMLAYEIAARTGAVAHVVATCLLDPADPHSLPVLTRWNLPGRSGPRLLRWIDPVCGRLRVPIRWITHMDKMSLDPDLSRLCAADPLGGGARIPLGFLRSFVDYRHAPPQEFTAAPVTLVHPAADQWTPPELSIRFLERIPARRETVLLDNCGHFPVEEPGVAQLAAALRAILAEASGSGR